MDQLPLEVGTYQIHMSDWTHCVQGEKSTSSFTIEFDGVNWDKDTLKFLLNEALPGTIGYVEGFYKPRTPGNSTKPLAG